MGPLFNPGVSAAKKWLSRGRAFFRDLFLFFMKEKGA